MDKLKFVVPELGRNCAGCPLLDQCIGAQAILSVKAVVEYANRSTSYKSILRNLLHQAGVIWIDPTQRRMRNPHSAHYDSLLYETVRDVHLCRGATEVVRTIDNNYRKPINPTGLVRPGESVEVVDTKAAERPVIAGPAANMGQKGIRANELLPCQRQQDAARGALRYVIFPTVDIPPTIRTEYTNQQFGWRHTEESRNAEELLTLVSTRPLAEYCDDPRLPSINDLFVNALAQAERMTLGVDKDGGTSRAQKRMPTKGQKPAVVKLAAEFVCHDVQYPWATAYASQLFTGTYVEGIAEDLR